MSSLSCKNALFQSLTKLGLKDEDIEKIWQEEILPHHTESIRAYHNFDHLAQMLGLLERHRASISDHDTVILSTLYHDIIYDPTSPQNEENSADLFIKRFTDVLPQELITKVAMYIHATKSHNVFHATDRDLQWFIDFDMSILGSPFAEYQAYALKIRQEYAHVSESDFCTGRANFLRKTLTAVQEGTSIYATNEMRALLETQALHNLEWEISHLDQKRASLVLAL